MQLQLRITIVGALERMETTWILQITVGFDGSFPSYSLKDTIVFKGAALIEFSMYALLMGSAVQKLY